MEQKVFLYLLIAIGLMDILSNYFIPRLRHFIRAFAQLKKNLRNL